MLYLAAILLLVLAIVAIVVLGVLLDPRRASKLTLALDARAADLDAYREHSMELVAGFATEAVKLSRRDAAEMQLVLGALISDRQRLVTAALAAGGTSPAAATLLARADQAVAQQLRPMTARDLLDESLRERAASGVDNEFETDEGQPIIPVGM